MSKTGKPSRNNHRLATRGISQKVEKGLGAFMDASVDAFLLFDEELNLVSINPAGERMLGISKDIVEGKNILDLAPGIKKTGRYDKYLNVMKTGDPFFAEDIFHHPRLGEMHLSIKAFKMRKGLGMIVNDITERRRLEEALRESEEKHRRLLDWAPDIIFRWSPEKGLDYVNRAATRVTGYTVEELMGSPMMGMEIAKEGDERLAGDYERITAGKSSMPSREVTLVRKDGKRIYLDMRSHAVRNEKGEIVAFEGILRDMTDRRRMEEALKHSEKYFRALIENSQDAIVIIGGDLIITYGSPSVERMLGYKQEELIGTNGFGFVHPDDIRLAMEAFAGLSENPDAGVRVEVRIRHKDGSWRNVEAVAKNLLSDEAVRGIVVNWRDITERKRMEEELRLLSDAVKMTTDSVAITDMSGRIMDINEAGLKMYGLRSRADFIGQNPLDAIAPEDRDRALKTMAKVIEAGQVNGIEYHVLRRDGSKILIETSVSLIQGEGGKPKGLVAVARDITERKRMEEALRKSEQNYRVLFESMIEGVFVIDAETMQMVLANQRVAEIGGFDSAKDVVGIDILEYIHPEDRDRFIRLITEDMFEKDLRQINEFRIRTRDGKEKWISAVGTRTEYLGRLAGLVSITDITERKKAEEERRKLEEQLRLAGRLAAVGELAAGVAHELNNPLAAIQGYAQLLASSGDVGESIKKDIEVIYREALRASKITKNLLSFARRHEPEKRLISINEVIEKTLELRVHQMKLDNIEVVKKLASDLPKTMADFHQMQQVFVNIVNNAEQAMIEAHKGGKLIVRSEVDGGVIRVSFRDDGPGISEENLTRVFDPFFTTKEVGKGTGLGLSICYGIVEAHGGRIYARSKLGEGATFIVELPIVSGGES